MHKLADWVLRISLAFAFLYPPISALSDPFSWIGYIPPFAYIVWPFSHMAFLHTFGIVEIVLALWLLTGWRMWIPATIMGLMLVTIVVTNTSQFELLFRDLAIAGLAFGLAIMHSPRAVRFGHG